MGLGRVKRLAIVVSHPIQYLSHVYRRLGQQPDLEVKVFYGSKIGLETYRDPGFGIELAWKCDLVGGFNHEFLPGHEHVQDLRWRSLARVKPCDALDQFDPAAVLVHGYSHPLALRALTWSRSRRRQALLFGDGNGKTVAREGRARAVLKRTILSPVLSSFNRVLTLGESNEQFWLHRGAEERQLQWAPMLLPMPELTRRDEVDHLARRQRSRRSLDIDGDDVVVMYCGKFQGFKRVMDLVRAVDQCSGVVGVYVGDGVERASCQKDARTSRHRFMGFANIPELAALYSAADVYCHPSSRENYGLVIAEAAACGLPIVATSITGAIGARSHGQVGRNAEVYEPGDLDTLANILHTLASDSSRRTRMGHESLQVAAEMDAACFRGVRTCVLGRE